MITITITFKELPGNQLAVMCDSESSTQTPLEAGRANIIAKVVQAAFDAIETHHPHTKEWRGEKEVKQVSAELGMSPSTHGKQ